MASYDHFNPGCSDLDPDALHFCSDAFSLEKSNTAKAIGLVKPYEFIDAKPLNSTNTRTNESENPCHSTETEQYNCRNKMLGDAEGINQQESFNQEDAYLAGSADKMVNESETVIHDLLTPTTDSFTGGEECRGCDFNLNKMETEEECIQQETTPSKAIQQSKFKNKLKELMEKAIAIFKHFAGLTVDRFNTILKENMKTAEEWMMDGEEIRILLERFELQVKRGLKRESEKTKKDIIDKLEVKQSCCFAELFTFKERIQQCITDVMSNFNTKHKDKVSQNFFKKRVQDKDLFSWILLHQIALAIIPRDQETLQLLSLKKGSIFFNTWIFKSKMNEENKTLFKGPYVRNHLRKVLREGLTTLMKKAAEVNMEAEKFELLKEISDAFERSQRAMHNIIGLRTTMKYDIIGEMTKKRSSELHSVKSEKITKKVNKDRK